MKSLFYHILAVGMAAVVLCGCEASTENGTAGSEAGVQQDAGKNEGADAQINDAADAAANDITAAEETVTEAGQGDLTSGKESGSDAGDRSNEAENTDAVEKKKDESPATGYMIGDHERTSDGIKAYLGTLSDAPGEFAKAGGLALSWNGVAGMRNLVAFEERYEAGEEAEIAIMQYTVEGDPILDYLYYDGMEVWYVRDNSRDKWGGPENLYWEARYPFVLFFTQKAEERDRMHSIVLSVKDGLTYDECTQIFFEDGSGEEIPAIMFLASFFYTDADL